MCNFFSCIILKDGRVFRNEEIDFQSDNHETIRNAHPRLLCNSGDSSEWVRIEIKPPNQNIMEKNLKKWEYMFDSNYPPSWYERNVQHYKDLCLAELGRIMIPYWDKMKTLDLRTALESGDKQSVKLINA